MKKQRPFERKAVGFGEIQDSVNEVWNKIARKKRDTRKFKDIGPKGKGYW